MCLVRTLKTYFLKLQVHSTVFVVVLICRHFFTQDPPPHLLALITSLGSSSFIFPGENQMLLLCPASSRGPRYPSIFLGSLCLDQGEREVLLESRGVEECAAQDDTL